MCVLNSSLLAKSVRVQNVGITTDSSSRVFGLGILFSTFCVEEILQLSAVAITCDEIPSKQQSSRQSSTDSYTALTTLIALARSIVGD